MTSTKFNVPNFMGNCKDCHYFTPTRKKFEEGVCHRYPKPLDREDMDYCGEFVWRSDAAWTKIGSAITNELRFIKPEKLTDICDEKSVYIGSVKAFPDVSAGKTQLLKIMEESAETYSAWETFHRCTNNTDDCEFCDYASKIQNHNTTCPKTYLIDECSDVIQAVCNLLSALGVYDATNAMKDCEERNESRGRYSSESGDDR